MSSITNTRRLKTLGAGRAFEQQTSHRPRERRRVPGGEVKRSVGPDLPQNGTVPNDSPLPA